LKILKRDGVLIFESKAKAATPPTLFYLSLALVLTGGATCLETSFAVSLLVVATVLKHTWSPTGVRGNRSLRPTGRIAFPFGVKKNKVTLLL
jgi:hypothetical protein